jgi:uncharacterized membrane-anchored protein
MNILPHNNLSPMLNKVPEVTLVFWLIKIMCTTVGETAADFLIFNLNIGLTVTSLLMLSPLAVVMMFQLRARKYVPSLYWMVVVMISIVGTLITDNLVDNFGVALETTTIVFGAALALTFYQWERKENSLSIHTIFTRRRELFYWAAILLTFALGTAAGDLVAEGYTQGYAKSILLFGGVISAITLAHFVFKINATLSFWIAYILTRPLGASLGDYLSQPTDKGGLGINSVVINLIFFIAIVGLVRHLTLQQKKSIPQRRISDLHQ